MEKSWYFSVDGQDKKGPVPESELQQMLAAGQLPSSTLVWSEGMANWAPIAGVTSLQPVTAPAAVPVVAPVAAAPVAGGAPLPQGLGSWMSFVGIMHIIMGACACLSCIGLIYGIPMIMGGAGLVSAKNLLLAQPGVDPALLPALEKQRSAFKTLGWGYILMLVFSLIILVVYIVFIAAMVGTWQRSMAH